MNIDIVVNACIILALVLVMFYLFHLQSSCCAEKMAPSHFDINNCSKNKKQGELIQGHSTSDGAYVGPADLQNYLNANA